MTNRNLRNMLPITLLSKVCRSIFGALRRQKLHYSLTVLPRYDSLRCSLLPSTASKCDSFGIEPVRPEKRSLIHEFVRRNREVYKNQEGIVLANLLVFTIAFTIIGLSLATFTISEYSQTSRSVYDANATMVAEAGVEQSLNQINQNESFSGYSGEQEFFNNQTQGRGTFTTSIEDSDDGNSKSITSTGYVYRYDQSNLVSKRSIKVTIVGTASEGYSVQSGPGGLILSGSANITNADVYVNGEITLTGASRIGTDAQPLDVKVANQVCPSGSNPGPSYPQICTGNQPINIQDWSSVAVIGDVCATGQTQSKFPESPWNNNPPQIRGGSSGQGLIPGCTAPPVSQPEYDRQAHKDAVTTTAAGNNNSYVCQSWPFDRSWPDNLKLTGNVNIGGSCDVEINGDAYITGDLDIGGAAKIRVSESAGTDRPVVMVDGDIDVGGSAQIIANSQGTGIHFISFKSNASCSAECTNLSGNELKNTQNLLTVDVGGAVNLPGMIFQAYWGRVKIAGSGNIGSAVGQTVDMSGAGTVTFGTGLSSGSKTWTITSYQEIFE